MNGTICFRIKSFIRYWLTAKPRGGFGVHSPFAYRFITNVLEEDMPYYAYNEVEQIRSMLLNNKQTISVTDYGTGPSCKKRVCDIARNSLKDKRLSQLIFRIAVFSKAQNILELGTSLGITTLYLAKSNPKATVKSLEGCPQTAEVAKMVMKTASVEKAEIIVGNIDNTLSETLKTFSTLDLVFFDANHRKEPTLSYFKACLPYVTDKTVFIFDDINHSQQMSEAWEEIKRNDSVKVTIDIYSMGIVFFNKSLQKEDYKIHF
ncbi:MAG: class I SAM-dependent methyltransferase [Paludibacteraceae bacterium]|nr:class I SAM-dependent methyltransferase [Paludibacteraceae bacterium]